MSEWYENQIKPKNNFRKFLKERSEKANPRRTLTTNETKRLAKLEGLADKLKRGENVQNRQLQTWLSEYEYARLSMSGKNSLSYVVSLKINQAT